MGGHVHYIFSMLLPTVARWIPARQKSAQHIHNIRRMKGEQIDGQGVTPAPVPAPRYQPRRRSPFRRRLRKTTKKVIKVISIQVSSKTQADLEDTLQLLLIGDPHPLAVVCLKQTFIAKMSNQIKDMTKIRISKKFSLL